jgi:hypothetical protein
MSRRFSRKLITASLASTGVENKVSMVAARLTLLEQKGNIPSPQDSST